MTNNGAKPTPDSGERGYLIWLSLVGVWVLVQVLVLAIGASPVFEGGLIGTDGYMRLVRVELLHETGAWFDGTIARSNAPYGDTLHWTRPFDVLVLGAAWLLSPFLGFEKALFWGGSFVSPLLLLATACATVWAAKPVVAPEYRPYIVLAFLAQLAVMAYSLPGRIDHHTLQMLLMTVTVGLVLRLCHGQPKGGPQGRPAALAGVVLALGLWVSVEFMLVVLLAMAAVWLVWLRHGRDGSGPALAFAAALAGALVLVLAIERPPSAILDEEYDRVSIVYLAVALCHLLFWVAVFWAERRSPAALSSRGRLFVSGLGAVFGAAAIYGVYPKFFGGGMVDVDPEVVRIFLSKVKELKPLVPTDLRSFGEFLFWLGPVLISLPFAAFQAWTKRREDDGPAWAFFALALGLFFAFSLRHVRFAPFAELLAVVPLVCLIGVLRERLGGIANQSRRELAQSLVSLVVILGLPAAGLVLGFRPQPSGQGVTLRASASGVAALPGLTGAVGDCSMAPIAAFLNRPEGFGDRPRIIATHVNFGPELLYRTRHAVVAAPYHRNAAGIIDIQRMFSAVDPAESAAIVDARGIELALLCPSPREHLFYANEAEGVTLYQRLLRDRGPPWLVPVALPDDLTGSFRLYQVIR